MSKSIEMFLIFLPYLKPHNITLIPQLDVLFKVWKILATVWLLIKLFQEKKLSIKFFLIIPFCFIWLFSMIINQSLSIIIINCLMTIIGLNIYYYLYKDDQNTFNVFVGNLSWIARIYLVCQIVTMLLIDGPLFGTVVENGYDRYFLGGDNLSAFIMLVLTTIIFYSDYSKYNKISGFSWLLYALEYCCLIKYFVGAGIISFSFFFIAMLLKNNKTFVKWFTPSKVLLMGVVFICLVAFGNLSSLLNSLLQAANKGDFNGRTQIWAGAITAILKKPLLGYGSIEKESFIRQILYHANHSHNIVLEYLFEVGAVGVLSFCFYIKRSIYKRKQDIILILGLSAYLINSFFDFYITSIYFYLLILLIIWDSQIKRHTGVSSKPI